MKGMCPNCLKGRLSTFYQAQEIPVHSVLLLVTETEALALPKGAINLGFCDHCGFISNTTFDARYNHYGDKYEATQGYSPTFNEFHQQLANQLIKTYNLYAKKIIEIGCGQGEFLDLLCRLGNNRGVGFDPVINSERTADKSENIKFIKDFYSVNYSNVQADFICCKMTLEHLPATYQFLSEIRQAVDNQRNTVLFFQIPNTVRILEDCAFWDIYYEHCSYFTATSLNYLFQDTGYEVLETWTAYNNQYLMITARPSLKTASLVNQRSVQKTQKLVQAFKLKVNQAVAEWASKIAQFKAAGQRIVLWGSGSKAVTFLNTLALKDTIEYVVDINPYRQGTYIAGTGQMIKRPAFLTDYQPHHIIIMNPIYKKEIQQDLSKLGVVATLHCL
ncbi:MAG: class I SAM-dependent methyltransferase [Bacteroidota bacterium]